MTRTAHSACPTLCQPHCSTHMPNAMPPSNARTYGRTDLRRILGSPGMKSLVDQRARDELKSFIERGRRTTAAARNG